MVVPDCEEVDPKQAAGGPQLPSNSFQENKQLSASHGSLKSITDYDSSATMSADEGPHSKDEGPPPPPPSGDGGRGGPPPQGGAGSGYSMQSPRDHRSPGSGLSGSGSGSQGPGGGGSGGGGAYGGPGGHHAAATGHGERPGVPFPPGPQPRLAPHNYQQPTSGTPNNPGQRSAGYEQPSQQSDLSSTTTSPRPGSQGQGHSEATSGGDNGKIGKGDRRMITTAACVRDLIHSAIERNLAQDFTTPNKHPASEFQKYLRSGQSLQCLKFVHLGLFSEFFRISIY